MQDTNGGAAAGSSADAEARKRVVMANQRTRALGQIVALLTRSEVHQRMTVADIKSSIVPPVLLGQFVFAGRSMGEGAGAVPVTALLWARVSVEADQRLLQSDKVRPEIAANEWASGPVVWLTDAAGDLRALPQMIERLCQNEWKGHMVRIASRGADGVRTVRTLNAQI